MAARRPASRPKQRAFGGLQRHATNEETRDGRRGQLSDSQLKQQNFSGGYHYVLVNRFKFQANVLSKALILKNPSTRVLDSGFSHLIMTTITM